ncbi:hypothetical protein AMECASPLE_016146 [Ameca splendens]|uniref:Uncharacterized protein n=1 Tax=Ameca splendens TaxID=208324 RepID=A0ABV0ZXW4_9TELE
MMYFFLLKSENICCPLAAKSAPTAGKTVEHLRQHLSSVSQTRVISSHKTPEIPSSSGSRTHTGRPKPQL